MPHVAVYARISRDPEGRSEGVTTQERKGRRLAAEQWPDLPVTVYTDNDLSAADPTVDRPGYRQLLDAIRSGHVTALVCAEQSRLTRQPAEWEDLVVTLSRAGIDTVHTYRQGPITVAGSRLLGRILAAVDAEEVERTRVRIAERLDALRAEGRPIGRPGYGYRVQRGPDGRAARVIVPDLAGHARYAADAVLHGTPLGQVARQLTDRGAPTARGGEWTSTTVRSMLTAPSIAGLQAHRDTVVGRGDWEPILDEATWRRVRAVLDSPVAVTTTSGRTYRATRTRRAPRRYLLTGGLAVCGRCGTPLVAQRRRRRKGEAQPAYLCHPGNGGCSGLGIVAEPFEAHVTEQLLARLETPRFAAVLAADTDADERHRIAAQLADLDQRRTELAQRWADGQVTSTEWDAARTALDARHADLAAQLDRLQPAALTVDPGAIRADWEAMTLAERRHVAGLVLRTVIVRPARPGTRRFDPGRVVIEWR